MHHKSSWYMTNMLDKNLIKIQMVESLTQWRQDNGEEKFLCRPRALIIEHQSRKELLSFQKIIENTCTVGRPFIQVRYQ